MKIFLENLYHSDCYFLPIRDNQQDLVGVELITHFSSEDGTVRIPTSRVIGNLGAGNSTMKAVFDGLFTRVMLDKSFIQQQITHRSFEPFIRAIQAQISPCCNCIIAGGIDTPEIMAQITPFDFHALQGCLWPAVPVNQITTLVQR
ncbi:hypothetical protein ACVEII_005055 [Escherichia coli]